MNSNYEKPIESGKSSNKKLIKILLIILLILVVCCAAFFIFGNLLPQTKSIETPTSTQMILPTFTPSPVPVISPELQLQQEIENSLGTGNRDIPRLTSLEWDQSGQLLVIHWAIDDNLTEDLIKLSARIDIFDILKTIDESSTQFDYQIVALHGYFPMQDVYGNSKEERVVMATYSRQTIEKIDWTNFIIDNIYLIAETNYLHPAFK